MSFFLRLPEQILKALKPTHQAGSGIAASMPGNSRLFLRKRECQMNLTASRATYVFRHIDNPVASDNTAERNDEARGIDPLD